jgi:hypothetical protein
MIVSFTHTRVRQVTWRGSVESKRLGRPQVVDRNLACVTEGCPRKRKHINGLCSACYQRLREKGTTTYTERTSVIERREQCVNGCGRFATYLSGLCPACYQKERADARRTIAAEAITASALAAAQQRFEAAIRSSAWGIFAIGYYKRTSRPMPELGGRMIGEQPDQWRTYFVAHGALPDDAPKEEKSFLADALAEAREKKDWAEYSPEVIAERVEAYREALSRPVTP